MENQTKTSLSEIRKGITKIDNQMAALFEDRMKLVGKVADYKKANGLAIYDPAREEQVLLNGSQRIKEPEYKFLLL